MKSVRITGGKSLKGEVIPQGAKNEALQVLSAVLLTDDKVIINNIPDIIDAVSYTHLTLPTIYSV